MQKLSAVEKPWALITGGSRGLGFALARECARKGYHLFLIARTEEALRQAAGTLRVEGDGRVEILPLDLSQEDSFPRLSKALEEKQIIPEIWINNAGEAYFKRFTQTATEEESGLIRLNVLAITAMTRLALSIMKQGHLVNVASTAAFIPGPGASLYYASKSFVLNFTMALSVERKNKPVTVSVLCPGPLDTEMLKMRGDKGKRAAFLIMSPQKAARYALKKITKGKRVIIPGLLNKIMVSCTRVLPLGWIAKIIARSNLR
ncbi:SDR family oxidoreductase [Candidatus Mcinerneyibacteriota bacterium]|nr:SDR family oxidoreductase [Candidatus Mcinerneyibacteriota bacterium]